MARTNPKKGKIEKLRSAYNKNIWDPTQLMQWNSPLNNTYDPKSPWSNPQKQMYWNAQQPYKQLYWNNNTNAYQGYNPAVWDPTQVIQANMSPNNSPAYKPMYWNNNPNAQPVPMPSVYQGGTPQAGYMNQPSPYQYAGQNGGGAGYALGGMMYAPQPIGYAGGTPQAGYPMTPNVYDPTMTASIPGGYTAPATQSNWGNGKTFDDFIAGASAGKAAPGWYYYNPVTDNSWLASGMLEAQAQAGKEGSIGYYDPNYGKGVAGNSGFGYLGGGRKMAGIGGGQFGQMVNGEFVETGLSASYEGNNPNRGAFNKARKQRRAKYKERNPKGAEGYGVQGASSGNPVNWSV